MRLYELAQEYQALYDAIDLGGGEVARTDTGEAVDLERALAELRASLEKKAEGVLHVLRNLGADIEALAAEEARLRGRRNILQAGEKRLREYVLNCFRSAGISKLKLMAGTLSLTKGYDRVEIDDEKALPLEFVRRRTITESDLVKIKAALDAGRVVPGARMIHGTSSLRVTIGLAKKTEDVASALPAPPPEKQDGVRTGSQPGAAPAAEASSPETMPLTTILDGLERALSPPNTPTQPSALVPPSASEPSAGGQSASPAAPLQLGQIPSAPVVLTLPDILARIGENQVRHAEEVLAAPETELASVTPAIVSLASARYGDEAVEIAWRTAGGNLRGFWRKRFLRGRELRAFVAALPVKP